MYYIVKRMGLRTWYWTYTGDDPFDGYWTWHRDKAMQIELSVARIIISYMGGDLREYL